jgi:hypothetical protein
MGDIYVWRLKNRPGKFTVIVPDTDYYNLSPNYGECTEEEVKMLLTQNYKQSPSEIEALIRQAKAKPEFPIS